MPQKWTPVFATISLALVFLVTKLILCLPQCCCQLMEITKKVFDVRQSTSIQHSIPLIGINRYYFILVGADSCLPTKSMRVRIFTHTPSDGVDLSTVLSSNLSYKIAVTQSKYVEAYPDTFELGDCEYGVAVDALLEHILLSYVGSSEVTTVSRNSEFLKVFDSCCGFTVYRDHVDPSSTVSIHPNDTVVTKGCIGLINVAKADLSGEEVARRELIEKLSRDAVRVFPANGQAIFGMTTFPNRISIYSIAFDTTTNTFNTTRLSNFDMRHLKQRVLFIKAVFKIAQWMAGLVGPLEPFYRVRTKTPSGYHITWTKDCLLKELKQPKTTTTGATIAKEEATREGTLIRIGEIYTAQLPDIEWGTVELPNFLKVTRIGFMLQQAILMNMITKDKALADIRQGKNATRYAALLFFILSLWCCSCVLIGVADLHALGNAHTDIKVANIFVDNGYAFLGDLEYVVSATAPARPEGRGLTGVEGQTAQEQDLVQLELLADDILRL